MPSRRIPRYIAALLVVALICCADLLPHTTTAFTNGQPASLVLGQPDFTRGGSVNRNSFSRPFSIAVDTASGKVFVSDRDNHRVLRYAAMAALTNGADAEAVLGQSSMTIGTPATSQTGLHFPEGITLDSAGRLWVADTSNNRVLRFDNAASKPSGAAAEGVLGQASFTTSSKATTAPGMSEPAAVAVDSAGRLWVADRGNSRVLRFDNAASRPGGAAADRVLGQPNFTSDDFGASGQGMRVPSGVAVDGAGRLWVADSGNTRVVRFDNAAGKPNGASADGVLGQPDFSYGSSELSQRGMYDPTAVAVDSAGRLWVADRLHYRVLRFDNAASKPDGANADGVLGQPDFDTAKGQLSPDGLNQPTGVAVDGAGRLWVADIYNRRVLRFDNAASKPNGAAANGVLGSNTLGEPLVTAQTILSPAGMAVDPVSGKLFVADASSSRVLRFPRATTLTSGAAAEGVLGQPDFTSTTRATTSRGMTLPYALAFDSAGRLWVADTYNHRVLRFDNAASKPDGAAADAVLGQPDFTSSGFTTAAQRMHEPLALAVDSAGRLWVADTSNHRVLRFDNAASKPNGAAADAVLGQPDFVSKTAMTAQHGMSGPFGLTTDSAGRLWVADTYNHRVLRFDNAASKPDGAPADGVLGQPDFVSGTATTTQQGLRAPFGLTTDSSGRLWVADAYNARVLRFDSAASKPNGAAADAVLGQDSFTSNIGTTTQRGMRGPTRVLIDSAGRLWVADTLNSRVLMFDSQAVFPRPRIYLPVVRRP